MERVSCSGENLGHQTNLEVLTELPAAHRENSSVPIPDTCFTVHFTKKNRAHFTMRSIWRALQKSGGKAFFPLFRPKTRRFSRYCTTALYKHSWEVEPFTVTRTVIILLPFNQLKYFFGHVAQSFHMENTVRDQQFTEAHNKISYPGFSVADSFFQ